jgi:hypothetical protein
LALSILAPACAQLHDRVQDLVHGWDTCEPASPKCFEDPQMFYSQPIIAAQETWRGRDLTELLAAWGQPYTVESQGDGTYRYVWREVKTVQGEMSYQHDQWSRSEDWDLVRNPDQTFECLTYMQVDAERKVTPLWVNRLGMCSQYFDPRVPAAPVAGSGPAVRLAPARAAAAAPVAAAATEEEESPIPLGPPEQIRRLEGY